MARPRITDEKLVASARQVAQQTQDIRQLRQALAVLRPAELNASLEQTASMLDRDSTRLNSSHLGISYAVFCLKKKQSTYFVLFPLALRVASSSCYPYPHST